MASRAVLRADEGRPTAEPAEATEAAPAGVRVAVLCALIALALYTVFAGWRLSHLEGAAAPSDGPARAALLAARADAVASTLAAAAQGGAELLRRDPAAALDAAEATLRLSPKLVRGAAIVETGQVVAQTGKLESVDWRGAASAATRSGRTVWIGAGPHGGPRLYAAAVFSGPKSGAVLVVADIADLAAASGGGSELLAAADGTVLSADGPGLGDAISLLKAVRLTVTEALTAAASSREVSGTFRNGERASLAVATAADRTLIAVAARPASTHVRAPRGEVRDGLIELLIPLAIALVLALMLLRQMRRTEAAHRARHDSEQRFRQAVEAARCGIWEWRLESDTVYLSDVTGVMFGWGGGGVVTGEELIARIAPEHRDRVRQTLRGAQTFGAFDVSFRVPGEGGDSAWIDARGQGFGASGTEGYGTVLGVALDVTVERTTDQRAQLAERRLQDAIESVSQGFILWDRHNRLVLCNQPYREFFALEPRLLKPGADRRSLLKLAELAVKVWAPAPEGRRGVREVEMVDGRWLQLSERRTADGGLVMTAADITAIKRQDTMRRLNEEALQRAVDTLEENRARLEALAEENAREKMRAESANRAKSEFLANMSHELRTPLNAINGFSEMMASQMFGPLGDPRYQDYARDILASGQHLLALINDILDMSKIEAGKMSLRIEPLDLHDVVDDVLRLMRNRAEAGGLTLIAEVDADLPEVAADYRALKQVLLNLLSNALKFTPRGGRAAVTARREGDGRVCVAVADTGIGISAEDLSRLAVPFEQIESQHAKTTQGTGLGLALTKSLIELHGGEMTIESRPGQGTTVSFRLAAPALAAPARARA